jgi:hypothetical protein
MSMKPYGLLICTVWASVITGAFAISADNPYTGIIDRNVFGLKAPPAPADPEANRPPPPKIIPTGITTILGNKRALFKVQMPARPPEPAKEQSFIMTEGQREGQIEVLEIDEKAGSIKFNDYGTVVTLSLEKDAPKPQPGPPVVAGAAPVPNQVYTPPPAVPGGFSGSSPVTSFGGSPNGGLKTIPTRTLRLPPGGSGPPGFPSQGNQPVTEQTLPIEQQMILMEIEREQHKNDPKYPPLPPTPLAPGESKLPAPPGAPQ